MARLPKPKSDRTGPEEAGKVDDDSVMTLSFSVPLTHGRGFGWAGKGPDTDRSEPVAEVDDSGGE